MGKTVEYIEREAVNQIIAAQCGECADACLEFDGIQPDCNQCLLHGAKKAIESIPAADVRPVVKAKWEDVHIDRPEIADLEVASMFCPNCNRWHNEVFHYGNPIEFANYCQFCGADMRPEPEEETE